MSVKCFYAGLEPGEYGDLTILGRTDTCLWVSAKCDAMHGGGTVRKPVSM